LVIEEVLGRPIYAAFEPYSASFEKLLDVRRLGVRLAGSLFEGGAEVTEIQVRAVRILADESGRQWKRAKAYQGLFYTPFRLYGGRAVSDEAGEDDVRQEHRELALTDGTYVLVREIQPGDAPALQRLVDRLSEQTIHLRFFGPMNELSDKKARYFAEVDGKDRYALVALDPEDEEEIVAVVRYDRENGTNRAEYAALVEDRFQGRGLGFGLTRALVRAARERGIRDFEALVLPQNRGMLRLLRSLDLPERTRQEDGIRHISVDLFPEQRSANAPQNR
jgi:RimJ/RimL family protein N-acetyltransferase